MKASSWKHTQIYIYTQTNIHRHVYTYTQKKKVRATSKFKTTQPHTQKIPKTHTLTHIQRRKITVSETQNHSTHLSTGFWLTLYTQPHRWFNELSSRLEIVSKFFLK